MHIFSILLQNKGNVPPPGDGSVSCVFYEKSSGTRSCLKVHIWPASSGEARQRCINSKRHVVRQCVAHAKVVVAWREKKGQICQQAVTSVAGSPCSRCDRDAI